MRTWGRVPDDPRDPHGPYHWVKVETDARGFNDMVWVTTLVQCLKLNLNESPFFADHGIPAHESVVQQVFPDYNVALTQEQFSQRFASLLVAKVDDPAPVYKINVTTHQGLRIVEEIAV